MGEEVVSLYMVYMKISDLFQIWRVKFASYRTQVWWAKVLGGELFSLNLVSTNSCFVVGAGDAGVSLSVWRIFARGGEIVSISVFMESGRISADADIS